MPSDDPSLTTASEQLLLRFQAGDSLALDRLWRRYLPRLKRWARGRAPASSRLDVSTDDLVQDALLRSLSRLRSIEPRGPGSVFAYVRTVTLNQIRDSARRVARQPTQAAFEPDDHVDSAPSPLEQILGGEVMRRYDAALTTLSADDQELLAAYVELRCSDRELAELLGRPSANAVRVARRRAMVRLARAMASEKVT